MANYNFLADYLIDLRQTPGDENLIDIDGQVMLSQEYAISRMNEIYGIGNWSIQSVKNELQKNANNNTAQNICSMTVEYIHPISGCTLTTSGTSPMNFSADEKVIQNAFLNAVAKLGATFGETLNLKPTAIVTEMPTRSNKLAAVI